MRTEFQKGSGENRESGLFFPEKMQKKGKKYFEFVKFSFFPIPEKER